MLVVYARCARAYVRFLCLLFVVLFVSAFLFKCGAHNIQSIISFRHTYSLVPNRQREHIRHLIRGAGDKSFRLKRARTKSNGFCFIVSRRRLTCRTPSASPRCHCVRVLLKHGPFFSLLSDNITTSSVYGVVHIRAGPAAATFSKNISARSDRTTRRKSFARIIARSRPFSSVHSLMVSGLVKFVFLFGEWSNWPMWFLVVPFIITTTTTHTSTI